MKQIIFVSGKECELSKQMKPIVESFKLSNPDIQVLELDAEKDNNLFDSLVGHPVRTTPVVCSLVDGKKLHHFEGEPACGNTINNMFGPIVDKSNRSSNNENQDYPKDAVKELFFITGEICHITTEVRPFVKLFQEINPDIKVTEIDIHQDSDKVNELFNGRQMEITPTYVSVINGEVKRSEHGKICENRLLNMFSTKEFKPLNQTFTPVESIVHQVSEAKKLVDDGLVKESGMPVDVKPYVKNIIDGKEITLDDVKDIFLFLFAVRSFRVRGWELPENLSNARIMWQLHGGDPAFEWSHKILQGAVDNGNVPLAGLGPDYITPDEFIARGEQY